MKISELNTKSFLGGTGAAANSYVLINYEDATTTEPVTYKASLQELGKAIANDQQLYKKTQNGAVTTNVSNNTYVNNTAEQLVTSSEKTVLEKMNYYITSDCQPHLKLYGHTQLDLVECITTGGYTDKNNHQGRPVIYDSTNEAFQYISSSNALQTISMPTNSNTPIESPTEGDLGKYVFLSSGELLVGTSQSDDPTIIGTPVVAEYDDINYEWNLSANGEPISIGEFNPADYEDAEYSGAGILIGNEDNIIYRYVAGSTPMQMSIAIVKESEGRPAIYNGMTFVGFLSTT